MKKINFFTAIIVLLTICNWIIETGRPMHQLSPINGFIYMLIINIFVFMDAIKLKSRIFVIVAGSIFIILNSYNIYGTTLGDWDHGTILFKYTIQGNEYTFMKRSTQRSIFLQIMLFGVNGVYTMLKDKKIEVDNELLNLLSIYL